MYANEVESDVMNLFLSEAVSASWEQLDNALLIKVGCEYFSSSVAGHQMLSFPCKTSFDKECKAHLKISKLTKSESEKALALHQYRRMVRRQKMQYYQMQKSRNA